MTAVTCKNLTARGKCAKGISNPQWCTYCRAPEPEPEPEPTVGMPIGTDVIKSTLKLHGVVPMGGNGMYSIGSRPLHIMASKLDKPSRCVCGTIINPGDYIAAVPAEVWLASMAEGVITMYLSPTGKVKWLCRECGINLHEAMSNYSRGQYPNMVVEQRRDIVNSSTQVLITLPECKSALIMNVKDMDLANGKMPIPATITYFRAIK